MEIIRPEMCRANMIPINFIYTNGDVYDKPDYLNIVYKDMDTHQHLVESIENPMIEIFIVKPQCRDFTTMRDYIEKNKCNRHLVPYRSRWKAAANILKLENSADAKTSPYIFGIDIPIENYYLLKFVEQYSCNVEIQLGLGYLDIESDVYHIDGIQPIDNEGRDPINAVTYIDTDTNEVHTVLLCNDNLPTLDVTHPKYEEVTNMRKTFYEQVDELKKNPDEFINELPGIFGELGEGMQYRLYLVDTEENLLLQLASIIRSCENDYIGIWNLPYDMGNIFARFRYYGMNPYDYLGDKRIRDGVTKFKEDLNPVVHKKNHTCVAGGIGVYVDDMVNYAGIRIVDGKLPSTKLNAIAKVELGEGKFDYSEVSDFSRLFYLDLKRFIYYNIKDVLLQVGIGRKTQDMYTIYSKLQQMGVFPHETFTTTRMVWYSFVQFIDSKGFAFGINRNRGNKSKKVVDYVGMLKENDVEIGGLLSILSELEESDDNFSFLDFTADDGDDNDGDSKKSEKFTGALVTNTLYMQETGYEVSGKPSKYIHKNVADLDIRAEYPSSVAICNISNDTLVGKVLLKDHEDVDVKIPEGFVFHEGERQKYTLDKSVFMMDSYMQGDKLNFGSIFLDLPTADEILQEIEDSDLL